MAVYRAKASVKAISSGGIPNPPLYLNDVVDICSRTGISKFLNLDEAQVRIIAPDVGGGFGYKTLIHPEELSVAWLAMKFRKPFRWIEDRREHLISGANSRQHSYHLKAYADDTGRLLALDAEVTIDGEHIRIGRLQLASNQDKPLAICPGLMIFRGIVAKLFALRLINRVFYRIEVWREPGSALLLSELWMH